MLRRFPAAAVAALLLAACKDTNPLRPTLLVTTDTLVAYALTGTPANLPSGLAVTLRSTVRVDATGSFDVAFDFDPAGNVVVSPVRTIVSQLTGVPSVGLQTPATTFDAITAAPDGYYRPDTAIVVSPGQPFVILTQRQTTSDVCYLNPSPRIYAKVVVDSVKPGTSRAIYLRQTVDPNCGFKSFAPGLPAN